MAYHSKYTGVEVDALLDKVNNGESGGSVTVDSSLSTTSANPVQNKVITKKLAELSAETEIISTEVESQNQLIEDLQNTKIEKENDDYYPKMAVGLADNLAGVDVVDSEINFRRSGGGAITDGVARIEAIKGNSVVWNQVIDYTLDSRTTNGITFTKNGDNSYVVSGELTSTEAYAFISSYFNQIKDHKYLLINDSDGSVSMGGYNIGGMLPIETTKIVTCGMSGLQGIALRVTATGAINTTIHPAVIDLTKMFRAGNEPTTIEEFYARIPMGVDLNAYNEGEVIHNAIDKIESVGVNQWDEEWVNGYYDATSGNFVSAPLLSSKNAIPVIGNMFAVAVNSVNVTMYIYCYNANGYLGRKAALLTNLGTPISFIEGTTHFHFTVESQYGSAYKGDICINLRDPSVNGKYFPYVKREQNLDIIGKYFPNGMKWASPAHDEIRRHKTTQKREAVKRIGEVKMKDLNWRTPSADMLSLSIFNAQVADMRLKETSENETAYRKDGLICSRYSISSTPQLNADMEDKSIFRQGAAFGVVVRDTTYTTIADFVASLTDNDVIIYELAEQIITELDEADQYKDFDIQVWNCGTEKAIAEGKSTPLAADITYGFNAVGKIKELENKTNQLASKADISYVDSAIANAITITLNTEV